MHIIDIDIDENNKIFVKVDGNKRVVGYISELHSAPRSFLEILSVVIQQMINEIIANNN